MRGEQVDDVVSGRAVVVKDDRVSVFLWPLGTSVLYFHKKARLQKPMPEGMGIIAHITSIPNPDHPEFPGTLGAPARRFIDWLAACGQRYWQVLPVNPTDEFGSPYAGLSAFAGNDRLLEGYSEGPTTFTTGFEKSPAYRRFCEDNEAWLLPAATFRAIKEVVGEELPWQQWPAHYRTWKRSLSRRSELKAAVERHCNYSMNFSCSGKLSTTMHTSGESLSSAICPCMCLQIPLMCGLSPRSSPLMRMVGQKASLVRRQMGFLQMVNVGVIPPIVGTRCGRRVMHGGYADSVACLSSMTMCGSTIFLAFHPISVFLRAKKQRKGRGLWTRA